MYYIIYILFLQSLPLSCIRPVVEVHQVQFLNAQLLQVQNNIFSSYNMQSMLGGPCKSWVCMR